MIPDSRRSRLARALALSLAFATSSSSCAIPDHPFDRIGEGTFFTFTVEDERELGEEFLAEVMHELPLVRDSEVLGYVRAVGAEIGRSAGARPFDYRFFVVRDPRINAFAGPAGLIFVHTGLLLAVQSEDELAGVLAHEAAHVRGRHIAANVESQQKTSIAALAGVLAGAVLATSGGHDAAQLGQAAALGSLAGATASILNHTRTMEDEADRQGMQILAGAGYDPRGMSGFFHRLLLEQRTSPIFVPPYLLTHPQVESRISVVEDMVDLVKRNPEHALGAGNLGRVQARARVLSDGPARAAVHFADRLKRSGATIDDRFGLALALKGLGRLPESYDVLRSVLDAWPEYARGWAEAGEILEASQRLPDALAALEKAHRLQSGDPDIERAYGRVLRALGRHDDAEAVYRAVVERLPDDPDAHHDLGVALGEKGSMGEAHLELSRAALLDRRRRLALYHLGQARDTLGAEDPRVKELGEKIASTKWRGREEQSTEKPPPAQSTRPFGRDDIWSDAPLRDHDRLPLNDVRR